MPRCTTSCPWKLHAPSHPAPPASQELIATAPNTARRQKKEKIIQTDHKQLMSRETLRQILVWVFSPVETRGEVTGRGEAGRGATWGYGPSGPIPAGGRSHPRFNPGPMNPKAFSHKRVSGRAPAAGEKGKRRCKQPFSAGFGQPGQTGHLPQLWQRRGSPAVGELFGAGAARISASCTEPSAVSVLSKSKIMSESTLPPIPR